MALEFSEKNKTEIENLLPRYTTKQAALLPVLFIAQEQFEYVSGEVMKLVAKTLDIAVSHVYGVATFYTMYNKQPVGKHHIQVCRTLPCALMGCEKIVDHIKKRLNIEEGETTSDKRFTLSTVECLASCDTGPMMQVNRTYYENLNEGEIDKILEKLR